MPDTTTTGSVGGVYSDTPDWYNTLAEQYAGQMSAGLTNLGGVNNNWFDGPLTASLTPEQTNLIARGAATAGDWAEPYATGMGNIQSGINMMRTASTFDPTQLQQFQNPYVTGVLDMIAQRGGQNLEENLLPKVNASFTGSGMFGSNRNADFNARALRDTNRSILEQQANTGLSAMNNAMQQYYNWGQLGTQAGQQTAQAGVSQGTQAIAGQQQKWTDLNNQYNLQEQQRQNTQAGYDASYKDWMAQLTTPYSLLDTMKGGLSSLSAPYQKSATTVSVPAASGSNSLSDLLSLIGGITSGANPQ